MKNHVFIHPESGATLPLPKPPKSLIKKKKKLKPYSELPKKVCVECGWNGINLSTHMKREHHGTIYSCPHCNIVVKDKDTVTKHIQWVHEKVPCEQCGELVGIGKMKRHIASKHTSIYDRKFKCDVCGKGFLTNDRLKDHKNVHTGEKPYKCQYCTSCFASKGTHAMHERSHLGHRRSNPK